MKLTDMKLGVRLGGAFAAMLTLSVLIAATAMWRLQAIRHAESEIAQRQNMTALASEWHSLTTTNLTRVMAIAKTGGQQSLKDYFDPLMAETSKRIVALQTEIQDKTRSERGKALLAQTLTNAKAYLEARDEVFRLLKEGDMMAAAPLIDSRLLPAATEYARGIEAYATLQRELNDAAIVATGTSITTAQSVLGVLTALAVALGAALAWLITRSVMQPLGAATQAAKVIASGDLSQDVVVDRKDELGQMLGALSEMQGALRRMVTQVRSATDSISTASTQIATGNQDLSARTEQTASNLQQTASSMEQLTGTVKQSADSARQANQLASSASSVAARGGQVVSQVVTTMDEINAASKKISDIIGVIDGIAFQTNILALNAAVEAARAGEQGRGFAVVAGEVRNLAQRSAQAAKEIKTLIGASVEKVESGSKLVQDAGTTMSEIVASVQRVADIIGEITAAAAEQSSGIGQVNTAVNQLDQMTQQNAALVEESAAAAESLKEQAHRLADVVGQFRVAQATQAAQAIIGRVQQATRPAAVPVPPPAPLADKAAPAPQAQSRPSSPPPPKPGADDNWETF